MLMIDILRLPGVEEAREDLIGDYDEQGHPVYVNERLVDDLIRAVAEGVEAEYVRRFGKIVSNTEG
jgi:hypothetical protein